MVTAYDFDDCTATDKSGNNNNGTIYGATCVDSPIAGGGKALSFDGVDDVVTVLNFGTQIPSKEITIEAWVKPALQTAKNHLICTDPLEPGGGYN